MPRDVILMSREPFKSDPPQECHKVLVGLGLQTPRLKSKIVNLSRFLDVYLSFRLLGRQAVPVDLSLHPKGACEGRTPYLSVDRHNQTASGACGRPSPDSFRGNGRGADKRCPTCLTSATIPA